MALNVGALVWVNTTADLVPQLQAVVTDVVGKLPVSAERKKELETLIEGQLTTYIQAPPPTPFWG